MPEVRDRLGVTLAVLGSPVHDRQRRGVGQQHVVEPGDRTVRNQTCAGVRSDVQRADASTDRIRRFGRRSPGGVHPHRFHRRDGGHRHEPPRIVAVGATQGVGDEPVARVVERWHDRRQRLCGVVRCRRDRAEVPVARRDGCAAGDDRVRQPRGACRTIIQWSSLPTPRLRWSPSTSGSRAPAFRDPTVLAQAVQVQMDPAYRTPACVPRRE